MQPGYAAQPNPSQAYYPPSQPIAGQAYYPPTQYGGPQPAYMGAPQQDQQADFTNQMEINKIDSHLSSGSYSCYGCWLYVMIILGGFSAFSVVSGTRYAVTASEGACLVFYSICMLSAMKSKNLRNAKTGFYLSFVVLILGVVSLFTPSLYVTYYFNGKEDYLYGIAPTVIYCILVVILPAIKVKGHLERRESLLMKSNISNMA